MPLGSDSTRFPPLPVSCSPGTGAAASSSTTRPTGTSPAPGPSDHGRVCAARRARSCTRRRRIRPWRCRRSRRPCRSTAACHIPSPWWCTPCRCTARHDHCGGRDRRSRHATRPTRSPAPTPAGAAPPCPWWWRTPLTPNSRMTRATWSRPISAGSQPWAISWAWTLRYPYTAIKKSA